MMKAGLLLLGLMLCLGLFAFDVPYSEVPLYSDANLLPQMQRVSPDDKVYESHPTKVWIWQDAHNLWLAYEAVIDSSFTPGPVSTRDVGNKADYLRLQLITMPDAYYSYLYNFYATGNLYDAVREVGRADIGFNTSYSYSTSINDNLWIVVAKIPLGELRFKQKLPYQWKIIVTRHHDRSLEDFSLPPVKPDMQNDYFAQAFDISLSHPVKRKLDLTFKPYAVKSYDLVNKTDSFDPDNIGLDIAFNPAQRTRIKLSLNPDFSDVPPDEAADLYNSKYPRYYMENRFFFTEDINAFGVGGEIFSSRRIVKPGIAFKATGSSQGLRWGVLAARDKLIIENGMIRNRDDYFQVLALTPNSKSLSLPTAIISRMNKDYYNHVLNFNYRWDVTKDFRLSSWNTFSVKDDDRVAEGDPLYGSAHNLVLNLSPGNWNLDTYATYLSRNLSADAGYMNERFFHKFGTNLGWDSEESLDYLSYQGFSLSGEYFDYYAKHNTEAVVNANYYINFRPKYGFSTNLSAGRTLDLANQDHKVWEAEINGTFFQWQAFSAAVKYAYNSELVYSLADTYNSHMLDANIWGTLSQVLAYDLRCTYKNYSYPHGILADYGGMLPYSFPLDDAYIVLNGELGYTPHQRLRLATGLGLTTYEENGIYNDVNLYGNLRYEFKANCFFYAGFNSNQLQDEKSTYADPMGHYLVNTATAYVKVSLSM